MTLPFFPAWMVYTMLFALCLLPFYPEFAKRLLKFIATMWMIGLLLVGFMYKSVDLEPRTSIYMKAPFGHNGNIDVAGDEKTYSFWYPNHEQRAVLRMHKNRITKCEIWDEQGNHNQYISPEELTSDRVLEIKREIDNVYAQYEKKAN